MKKLLLVFLAVTVLYSCDETSIAPQTESNILDISFNSDSSNPLIRTIDVEISKPTPCHEVSQVEKTISGNTYSYDIILISGADACTTVIDEEIVQIDFEATGAGEYVLNFLINGELFETRSLEVTE